MKKLLKTISVCVIFISLISNISSVGAYSTGDDYPSKYKNAAKDSIVDEWNFYNRECTSFVAWCLNSRNGVNFTNQYMGLSRWGHAKNWISAAQSIGITVDMYPKTGSVACLTTGTYGHVAWVKSVSGDNIEIEEYNYNSNGNFNTRTINRNSMSGYIHINDIITSTEMPIYTISLDHSELSMAVGNTATIAATVSPANSTVNWETNNPAVATVVAGKVTAVGEGTASITAKIAGINTVQASCYITVSHNFQNTDICSFCKSIRINEKTFPDENFRAYITENFQIDKNDDYILTPSEIADVTRISLYNQSIGSLKGIEFFTALQDLQCYYLQLNSLDVSKNTALVYLCCDGNQLTSLDVSKNTALESLSCSGNKLTSLDVSKNTMLSSLHCNINKLTSLNVSNNTLLESLDCSSNQLTYLDISKNTELINLNCSGNQLTAIDVSKNTALESLSCSGNQLTAIDVSKNTILESLSCDENNLTEIDLGDKINLGYINCSINRLTELCLESCPNLKTLWCYENEFSKLNLNSCPLLEQLDCSKNRLTNIDLSNMPMLIDFYCNENFLTTIDLKNNTLLEKLRCDYNLLMSLDLSNNTQLVHIYCGSNQLSSLNLSGCSKLESLWCENNQLSSLDLSSNTALTTVICEYNYLTSLDISNCSALTTMSCGNNYLTTLDVSKNTALESLGCWNNQLCALDLSANTNLYEAYLFEQFVRIDTSAGSTIDLKVLDPDIDISRIYNVEGGELNGSVIYVTGDYDYVHYLYDTGMSEPLEVYITSGGIGGVYYPGNENIQIVKWTGDDSYMDISYDVFLDNTSNCTLFTVIYDSKNSLIGCSSEIITFTDGYAYVPTRIYFESEPHFIKVFLWKNATTIQPLAENLVVELTYE